MLLAFSVYLMYSFLSRLRLAEERYMRYFSSVVGVVDGGINFCQFFFSVKLFFVTKHWQAVTHKAVRPGA